MVGGPRVALAAIVCLGFTLDGSTIAAQHMNAKDAACRDAGTTLDAGNCLSAALASRDRELGVLLVQVRAAVGGDELRLLNRAQMAWVGYRRLSCEAEYEMYGGGTGGPITRLACLEALTRDRIQQLHAAYDSRVEDYRWDREHPSVR